MFSVRLFTPALFEQLVLFLLYSGQGKSIQIKERDDKRCQECGLVAFHKRWFYKRGIP